MPMWVDGQLDVLHGSREHWTKCRINGSRVVWITWKKEWWTGWMDGCAEGGRVEWVECVDGGRTGLNWKSGTMGKIQVGSAGCCVDG